MAFLEVSAISGGRGGGEHLALVPDFEEAVPGSGADRHAVLCHAQAAHAVVVAGEDA